MLITIGQTRVRLWRTWARIFRLYYLAGVAGIEPALSALEADGLPLTDTPKNVLTIAYFSLLTSYAHTINNTLTRYNAIASLLLFRFFMRRMFTAILTQFF